MCGQAPGKTTLKIFMTKQIETSSDEINTWSNSTLSSVCILISKVVNVCYDTVAPKSALVRTKQKPVFVFSRLPCFLRTFCYETNLIKKNLKKGIVHICFDCSEFIV